MPAPIVSIILNNFNYAQFLPAAVESALSQTYPNCEVIVVDDGSTDESREILKQYEDRARIVLQENGGQVSAFNRGFQCSKGELVAFLDSDDGLFPDAIEAVVKAWQRNTVKLQFPLEILGPDGRPTGLLMPRARLSEGDLLEQLLQTGRYITSPTSGNVFSRSFLDEIFPLPVQEWDHGDAYLSTCAPFYGNIAAIHRPLGFYRVHGKSMSSVADPGSIDVAQMQKLVRHAMAEKSLLEQLAGERGFKLSEGAVVSHWMHLKLELALCKLSNTPGLMRMKLLAGLAFSMLVSVIGSKELTPFRKLQSMAWAIGVAVLPVAPARTFIQCGFDRAPKSRLSRLLRKA
jgi:glycosyltransferase involved in cell wall biosynthesis